MSFVPSEYSYGAADYSQLATTAIQVGGSLASQAIAQSGRGNGKKRHKAKMQEIEALTPDHSPLWPVFGGLAAIALVGFMVFRKPPTAAAA